MSRGAWTARVATSGLAAGNGDSRGSDVRRRRMMIGSTQPAGET